MCRDETAAKGQRAEQRRDHMARETHTPRSRGRQGKTRERKRQILFLTS